MSVSYTPPANPALHRSRAFELIQETIVALVTRVLEHGSVSFRQRHVNGPRFRKCRWIFRGDSVIDRGRIHTCEPLDHPRLLTGGDHSESSLEASLVSKVDRLDNERVAFPVATRIAHPPPDAR